MIATLRINNLLVDTIIGVHEAERHTRQSIQFDIEIQYNIQKALSSDQIDDVLDYDNICKTITEKVKQSHFHLLESLGNLVLDILMSYHQVLQANIFVTKSHCITNANSITLIITGKR